MSEKKEDLQTKYLLAPLPEVERGMPRALYCAKRKDGDWLAYSYQRHVIMRKLDDPRVAVMFSEHKSKVKVARYSPNGNWMASGDETGKCIVWGVANQIVKCESNPCSSINDISWDPESKKVAAGGSGQGELAKVFTYDTANKQGEITQHVKTILSLDFKPTRPYRLVTAAEDLQVNFYEGPPFKFSATNRKHTRYPNRVQYAPDGETFCSIGSDSKIIFYDGKTSELKKEILSEKKTGGHDGAIYSFCWSPDSKKILTCSADKTAKIWDVESGQVETTFIVSEKPTVEDMQMSCVWHGDYLISLSLSGAINYWDPANPGKPKLTIHGHMSPITACASDIASGVMYSGDRAGKVCVWNDGVAKWLTGKGHGKAIGCMAVSSDGGVLYTGGYDDKIMSHETKTGEFSDEAVACGGRPTCIVTGNKDADLAIVGVAQGKLLVLRKGKLVNTIEIKFKPLCVAINPSDSEIQVGGDDKQVHYYAVDGDNLKETRVFKEHRKPVNAVSYKPDGSVGASAGADLRCLISDEKGDIKNPSEWEFHTSGLNDARFSPSGDKIVTVANDLTVHCWMDTEKFKTTRKTVKNAQMDSIDCLTWLGNDSFATCAGDGSIKVWEL